MDAAGIARPHLVGNSLGGWIAAELAVRGRARSVVAFSPAGLHTPRERRYSVALLNSSYEAAQRLAPYADRLCASAAGRRLAFGMVAARPERLQPEAAAYQVRVFAASQSFPETLRWVAEGHQPTGLDRIECPFRVVWGTRDLLLPRRQGPRWERLVPGAELVDLPRLGHTPMSDDPELCAAKILEVTAPDRAH